jgi:hypothetical protein
MQAVSDQWTVVKYEVKMFNASHKILFKRSYFIRLPYSLKNAVEEAAVLHTRNLCEIILCRPRPPSFEDDILLSDLFADWPNPRYQKLKEMTARLDELYGSRKKQGTPCWTFNKHMAHSTTKRGHEFDYREILNELHPHIQEIIAEIQRLRGKQFPLRFVGSSGPPTLFWS